MDGLRLALEHPEVADRSCDDCRKWMYDDAGNVAKRRDTRGIELPILRPAAVPTPCYRCPKTEGNQVRTSFNAVMMTETGWQTYRHYRECAATLSFPDDPIVTRNASLIRSVLDSAERSTETRRHVALVTFLTLRATHA